MNDDVPAALAVEGAAPFTLHIETWRGQPTSKMGRPS
jgi:hypothetical protein